MSRHFLNSIPKSIRIVDVSARDGLQNEKVLVPTAKKLELIKMLIGLKFSSIELTSFVSPKWVPQMADNRQVVQGINEYLSTFPEKPNIRFPVLAPNLRGYEDAISAGSSEIAIFGAASESFSKKNINCSIKESLERFIPVCEAAKKDKIPVRGYVSTALGCPYEGYIRPEKVRDVALELLNMGCYEVSIGDTIGAGTIGTTDRLFSVLTSSIPPSSLAMHFHDTYGQALSNLTIGLQHGISVIDSAIGGVGGCPYAAGATGNVATEDVMYMLGNMEVEVNGEKVDMERIEKIVGVSVFINEVLGKKPSSRVANAIIAKCAKK